MGWDGFEWDGMTIGRKCMDGTSLDLIHGRNNEVCMYLFQLGGNRQVFVTLHVS
jgi:hypothetical protein